MLRSPKPSRFPFLFYSSTFVGEIYYRYEHPPPIAGSNDQHDALGNIGRLGSVALVIFSLITFCSSVLLPYVVKAPEAGEVRFTPRPPPSLTKPLQTILVKAATMQPDLTSAWLLSNLLFAFITVFAPWTRSLHSATALVALCGVPWAISCWAPFGLLGIEINQMSSGPHAAIKGSIAPGYTSVHGSVDEPDAADDIEMEEARRHRRIFSDGVLRLHHPEDPNAHASTGELAGIYLGVLNVYTTLPQFVGTFLSWIVFSILEPGANDVDGADVDPAHHKWLNLKQNAPNAIAVCMFVGALCSVISAEAARRLKRVV